MPDRRSVVNLIRRLRRSSHIHDDVGDRFRRHLDKGEILDLPAGSGVNARSLVAAGFSVRAADLFPDACEGQGFPVDKIDLNQPLPYADESFDGVLHSEGIEHLDAQVAVLAELARILKPGGILIVTTPNLLHLEGRLRNLLTGHAYRSRAVVVASSAYWGTRTGEARQPADTYFGHVFLINAFQLRFYLTHVGLDVVELDTTRYSWKSVLMAPVLAPLVWCATWSILRKKRSSIPAELQRTLRREITSGPVLFGRKLIMVARKPGATARRSR